MFGMDEEVPREGFADLYRSARVFMEWLMFDIMRVNMRKQTPQEQSDSEIWEGVCVILRDEFKEDM